MLFFEVTYSVFIHLSVYESNNENFVRGINRFVGSSESESWLNFGADLTRFECV